MFLFSLSSRPSKFMDGRIFFARSWFRSGTFVALTIICWGCIVYEFFLAYAYSGQLSRWVTLMFVISFGVVIAWWRALQYHERIRELYLNQPASNDPVAESQQSAILSVAAESISNLFFPFTAILLLLFWIGYLTSHHS